MTAGSDSTAVRAGEELELAALDRYLRAHLPGRVADVDPAAQIEIAQFPGGHSNLTYLIRYGDREFVLRRPPVGPVAPTAHDMPREYRLLVDPAAQASSGPSNSPSGASRQPGLASASGSR